MSTTDPKVSLRLAGELVEAIMANDVTRLEHEIFAPGVLIWHNNDKREQTFAENIKVLSWLSRKITGLRYEEIRCEATATGYVQQHVLRGTAPNGFELDVPACLVVTVVDERITRIEEYLDTAQLAGLAG